LVVTKKEEVDAVSVVDGALAAIEKFKPKLLADQKIITYNDEGQRVKDRLRIVEFNAFAGLITVLLILFAFLPGKVGIFSAASLPICALGTVAMMIYLDANFNIITMIALVICLGNLVDNSVVISEHYTYLREKGLGAKEAATQAAQQFWIPFTASTITIIAAFIPMLVTTGVLGQFIRWIPIVVTIALVLSLIESLTLLPARLQFLNPKTKTHQKDNWFTKVEDRFARLVDWTLNFRYLTAFGLTGLIVSSFFITAIFNRFELFPADGVEYYIARFETAPQTRVQTTDQLAGQVSQQVIDTLGTELVDSVIARSGIQQAEPGDPQSKNGENVGFLLIRIKQDKYIDLNIQQTLEKLRTIKKPEAFTVLTFESQAGGPPVGRPVTLTLRSSNYQELKTEVQQFVDQLAKIDGVKNILTDEYLTGEEYLFKPNDRSTSLVGLNNDQIGLNLRAALEGVPVAKMTERGLEFDVAVRYGAEDKSSIENLKASGILNQRGNFTRISLLGDIQKQQAPPIIKSYNFRRSITITADVTTEIITSAKANALARDILKKTLLDAKETSAIFGGEEESTNESIQSLAIALVLSIFGIFATLVFVFSSFSKPLLILSTIPLGLVGVNYAFTLSQRPLSFLAFIGVVGLSGVVINSAIILVDYIEELKHSEKFMQAREILVKASRQRLRAVLATGLTTVVGLLPTAFGIGGNDPLLIPITLALSWGMIIGTTLSLIWIPSCYLILEDLRSFNFKNFLNFKFRTLSK
ncbi:MAG: efflux RND transporter permease subunit, partial [Pseudobdellovibrionaceae bacterium]